MEINKSGTCSLCGTKSENLDQHMKHTCREYCSPMKESFKMIDQLKKDCHPIEQIVFDNEDDGPLMMQGKNTTIAAMPLKYYNLATTVSNEMHFNEFGSINPVIPMDRWVGKTEYGINMDAARSKAKFI